MIRNVEMNFSGSSTGKEESDSSQRPQRQKHEPDVQRFDAYTIDAVTVQHMLEKQSSSSLSSPATVLSRGCTMDTNFTLAWNKARLHTNESELRKAEPDTLFWTREKTFSIPTATTNHPSLLVPEKPGTGGIFFFHHALVHSPFPTIWDCSTATLFTPRSCSTVTDKAKAFPSILQRLSNPTTGSTSNTFWDTIDKVNQTAVLIWQFFGDEYFHAMIECLPRLGYVIEYLRANPHVVIVAGHKYLQSRSHEINRLLNITNPWMAYDPVKTYWIQQLMVPVSTRCGNLDLTLARILQYRFAQTLGPLVRRYEATIHDHDPTKPVILLHKRRQRGIINHEELLAALVTRFPNHRVEQFFGHENLTETAILHHRARVVVGPHGAGLSNLLFCRRNFDDTAEPIVGLVELHQQYGNWNGTMANQCHQKTAQCTGLYTVMIQQTDGSKFTDFRVDVTQAVEAVQAMLDKLAQ